MFASLHEVFAQYINHKNTADVRIIITEENPTTKTTTTTTQSQTTTILYAHKFVLSTASPQWMNKFYNPNWKDPSSPRLFTLKFSDIDADSFQIVLEYIYTRKPNIQSRNVVKVMSFAQKYQMFDLLKMCELFLSSNLTLENCLAAFEFSLKNSNKEIEYQAKEFIELNSLELFEKVACLVSLEELTIVEILKLKQIRASELSLFNRLMEWGQWRCYSHNLKANLSDMKEMLKNVLPFIRIELMGSKGIETLEESGLYPQEKIDQAKSRLLQELLQNREKDTTKLKPISQIKVLLIASDDSAKYREDVKLSITSTGIKNVDIFDATKGVPQLQQLQKYDVVFVYSASIKFLNAKKTGDVLAKYVESGKGLVLCSDEALLRGSEGEIQGKIIDYLPVEKGDHICDEKTELGDINYTRHAIMNGVNSFDGGAGSPHCSGACTKSGKVIAYWDDGVPLIVVHRKMDNFGNIVILNFQPPSDKVDAYYWDSKTDGAKIIANSVQFAASN
ncbi:btb (poz) domain-containing 2a-related [Anaeramoeba ignava]|uniref:Btb (Poz) domain-containing 2a-related n=1 Tax=Anaeramoeba ignava TaxID=1746090 RepID=A0A9Q0L6L6_ANAIG|nr:btb (poz) domain-containing 2a-related [Anaeramoeba ignava]KAJ5079243.1 btb (poz) domain-containing 2a-related [Anaeramoeba ignava]